MMRTTLMTAYTNTHAHTKEQSIYMMCDNGKLQAHNVQHTQTTGTHWETEKKRGKHYWEKKNHPQIEERDLKKYLAVVCNQFSMFFSPKCISDFSMFSPLNVWCDSVTLIQCFIPMKLCLTLQYTCLLQFSSGNTKPVSLGFQSGQTH